MSQLIIQNLAKKYSQRYVLNDISLKISEGEVVGLLGPNGAGKTTCFYMIAGLVKVDYGKIFINKKEITNSPIHIRANLGLGYLPQESSIFRKLSVYENIMAILETQKKLSKKQKIDKCNSLLNEFKIEHIRNTIGAALSGGERRRVEIARSLAIDPKFILLDEPFAGVDPISVNDIRYIIKQLKEKNIGILITDHNVRETLSICERAYIIGEGNVIAEGNTESILRNQKVRDTYLGHNFEI